MFSDRTNMLLQRFGWEPNRRQQLDDYRRVFQDEGFPMLPVAMSFLERFGGLEFRLDLQPDAAGPNCAFDFCADRAAAYVDSQWVSQDWLPRIGLPVTVIGNRWCDNSVILMDESGRVFIAFEDYLFHIADSGETAIDRLLLGDPRIGVAVP